MQNIDNRFRSVGIGELEIVYAYLYPNQQDLVNQIENSPGGIQLINDLKELKEGISPYVMSGHFGAGLWIALPNSPKIKP